MDISDDVRKMMRLDFVMSNNDFLDKYFGINKTENENDTNFDNILNNDNSILKSKKKSKINIKSYNIPNVCIKRHNHIGQ